jgi:DNA polymerase III epsilon subunit-like protein
MVPGKKRHETIILSIGAVSLFHNNTFHCFVKPKNIKSDQELVAYMEQHGANVHASKQVLKKIKYSLASALDADLALQRFQEFTGPSPVLIAHNGKSFDFKILNGCLERNHMAMPFHGLDSYHGICKQVLHLQSYKLGHVYKAIVKDKEKLQFHTALDDSKALKAVVLVCCRRYTTKHLAKAFCELYQVVNEVYGIQLDPLRGLCKNAEQCLKFHLKHHRLPDKVEQKVTSFAVKQLLLREKK